MKTWQKFKSYATAAWRALNEKDVSQQQSIKDIQAFNEFFDKVLIFVYTIFGIFSLISITLFATRVIF